METKPLNVYQDTKIAEFRALPEHAKKKYMELCALANVAWTKINNPKCMNEDNSKIQKLK